MSKNPVWLQIRQNRPDYVLLVGLAGVMTPGRTREAQATATRCEKMHAV